MIKINRMLTKAVAGVGTVCLALTLAACGSHSGPTPGPTHTTATPVTKPPTTPPTTPSGTPSTDPVATPADLTAEIFHIAWEENTKEQRAALCNGTRVFNRDQIIAQLKDGGDNSTQIDWGQFADLLIKTCS